MQIDRSRFLLLSASIAAVSTGSVASCGGQTANAVGGVEVATPVEVEPATGNEPIIAEAVTAEPGRSGPLDDKTLREMCDGLEPPPGPHCESFLDTKNDCSAFIDGLEPEAAEKAVECLAARSKTEALCQYDALQDCFVIGTSAVIEEPRLRSQCASVVNNCASNRWARGDLTMESCGSVMAAVKDSLEGEMISCMAEGCGIGSCVYRLR